MSHVVSHGDCVATCVWNSYGLCKSSDFCVLTGNLYCIGLTAKQQRKVSKAIKRARCFGLMPYTYKLEFFREGERQWCDFFFVKYSCTRVRALFSALTLQGDYIGHLIVPSFASTLLSFHGWEGYSLTESWLRMNDPVHRDKHNTHYVIGNKLIFIAGILVRGGDALLRIKQYLIAYPEHSH